MKKFLSLVLAMLMVISLTACGGKDEVRKPTGVDPAGDSSAVVDSPNIETPSGSESDGDVEAPPVDDSFVVPVAGGTETIEETVLLDRDGLRVTAVGFDPDAWLGPEVKVLVENNSGKDLTVQCRDSSVNGYMVETMMSVDVVNGKKASDDITFMSSDLDLCGIKTIADMEFAFHVFETDSWDTVFDSDPVILKTSVSDEYVYSFDDSGDVAYSSGDVRIVVKGLSKDASLFGPSVILYIENNGTKNITVQSCDVSVNGFMVDPIFSCDVKAGKHAVDDLTFMSSQLEDSGITDIESVELSFHIFDSDTWSDTVDTDVVTITF